LIFYGSFDTNIHSTGKGEEADSRLNNTEDNQQLNAELKAEQGTSDRQEQK